MRILAPGASATPAAVSVEEIRDPTAVGAGIELLEQETVQLQPLPLRARRITVRLDDTALVFHSTNRRVRTRTSLRPGLLAWVAFGPRTRGTVNGLPVRPGMVLAAEPGVEVGFVSEAGWQSVAYLLSARELGAHLAARRLETGFRRPRGVEVLRVAPEQGRRLFAWGKRLSEFAARQPARFDAGRQERSAARAELFETLLATVAVAGDHEPGPGDRSRRAQSLLVKRAEDFALANGGEPVQVGDLCRAAGVSERTLEYAFKEILGTTPTAYLIRLRLHRVRRSLLAAKRGTITVSAAALDAGFWHFGDFSRAYRGCFGELPSETLRRKPGPCSEGR
jgi:AraC family transcriptional regulator, ethanolamine operon transcriptional activator